MLQDLHQASTTQIYPVGFAYPIQDPGDLRRFHYGSAFNTQIPDVGSHIQLTQHVPWAVVAECKLGRGDRAMEFYNAMLPYNQNDLIEVRQSEPYSYCQFVMGRDHTAFGRARHPWLTGSGGWFYVAATQWILGIRLSFAGLVIDPCIPHDWKGFEVTRRWRDATYKITVNNPNGVQKGVTAVLLNGHRYVGPIPPQPPGSVNHVMVTMG